MTKSYSKILVGLKYHESRKKIQTAVAPRMSKLQAKPRLPSWLITTLSLAHLVTNRFFSFKKRTWVTASLCPLSRYKPLSLMTSHTMTSVSWKRQIISKRLAFVPAKCLPLLWDRKGYLRAIFLILNLNVMNDECKWHSLPWGTYRPTDTLLLFLFLFLTSQASSHLTALLVLNSCPALPAALPALGSPTPSLSCRPNPPHCHLLAIGRDHTTHLKY